MQLRFLTKSHGNEEFESKLSSLAKTIAESKKACELRNTEIPNSFHYPKILPFAEKAPDIVSALRKHQVLVVAGDTGSGKTTQLPKICLEAGYGRKGLIGHTQPRRLAAVSVANRVAEELGVKLGEGVGYQIRFNERLSANSFLKIMTDGILLTEIQQDRYLNKYEVIIIDEAHERSLNIDFLLGYLKWLLKRRDDLKLVITSATIDVEKFSAHFDDAPIIQVSGRTYPVEVRYAPVNQADNDSDNADQQIQGIIDAVSEIETDDKRRGELSGDILVFLSSEREIRETASALRKQRLQDTEILPLYSRLRHSEQVRIFQPHSGRRVVLSTNVAETSITVPGINYVIDTGLARISRYSLQNKVQRLPIEAVSQASANQRKGRCGRVADGVCIRLYSESDFNGRAQFTDPEILRTNLASVILRMQYLRLGDVADFPFLEPPATKAINDGYKLLIELNALDTNRKLTAVGKQMARLPVDPKYARMLVAANSERALSELLIIVSALSIQDPREMGGENRQQAAAQQERFQHSESDFLGLVNLWQEYEKERQQLSQGQLRKYCKKHYLSFMRMREWRELHRQLLLACQQLGFKLNKDAGRYDSVHKAIISGSLNQIAVRFEGQMYSGSRNKRFKLLSNSVLSTKQSKWIVTGDQIETTQTFASLAAKIQPEWVEEKALHLVKREYFEPHWSKRQQRVIVFEKVSLYGLVIIEKNPLPFSPIDQSQARELFIREGLVPEEVDINPKLGKFLEENRLFLDELARQEDKIRKPEHFVSENDIARFYEERIPSSVSSTKTLADWLKSADKGQRENLCMTMEALFGVGGEKQTENPGLHFPDSTPQTRNPLKIDYLFEPGHERDGATIEIPLAILPQVVQADIDWAVPGIVKEKCVALLKALPKSLRKNFIPVSGFVDEVVPQMIPGETDFLAALIAQIKRVKKIDIARSQFSETSLPNHLRIKVRVVGPQGEEVGFGENIKELQESLVTQAADQISDKPENSPIHSIEQDNLKDWDIGELPRHVEIGKDLVLIRYPALDDNENSVAVRLFAEESTANAAHQDGLTRLFILRTNQQRRMLAKQFAQFVKKNALLLPPELRGIEEESVTACYKKAFGVMSEHIRSKEEFEKCLNSGKQTLFQYAQELEVLLQTVLESRNSIRLLTQKLKDKSLSYVILDIEGQLAALFAKGFLKNTDWQWLKQYPRYLKAVIHRLDKAPHLGPKDMAFSEELNEYWRRYTEICDQGHMAAREEIDRFRWMIEEYRVSLFAQSFGTQIPVSAKRLDKAFEALAMRIEQ